MPDPDPNVLPNGNWLNLHAAIDVTHSRRQGVQAWTFPVFAPAPGRVAGVLWAPTAGNMVAIEHRDRDGRRWFSYYGHLRNGLSHDLHRTLESLDGVDVSDVGARSRVANTALLVARVLGLPVPQRGQATAPSRGEVQAALGRLEDEIPLLFERVVRMWGPNDDVIQVVSGQRVALGELIGFAGTTGTLAPTLVSVTSGRSLDDFRLRYEQDPRWLIDRRLDPADFEELGPGQYMQVRDNTHLHFVTTADGGGLESPEVMWRVPSGPSARWGSCLFQRFDVRSQIAFDPFGVYQQLEARDGSRQYAFLGPLALRPDQDPPVLELPDPLQGNAVRVMLRQHDPVFTAERVRAWLLPASQAPMVVGAPRGLLGRHAPFAFRPASPVRYGDRRRDQPVVGVARAWHTERARYEVVVVEQRSRMVPALERPGEVGLQGPFGCGTSGAWLPEELALPCLSEPDVATRPAERPGDGPVVRVIHATRWAARAPISLVMYEAVGPVGNRSWRRFRLALQSAPGDPVALFDGIVDPEDPCVRVTFDASARRWAIAWRDTALRPRLASLGLRTGVCTEVDVAPDLRGSEATTVDIVGVDQGALAIHGRAGMVMGARLQDPLSGTVRLVFLALVLDGSGRRVRPALGRPGLLGDSGVFGGPDKPALDAGLLDRGGVVLTTGQTIGQAGGIVLLAHRRDDTVQLYHRDLVAGRWSRLGDEVNLQAEEDVVAPATVVGGGFGIDQRLVLSLVAR